MDKKQTAVEWLINQVNSENYQNAFGQTYISVALIKEAKQMEKEQITDAYYQCGRDNFEHIKVINRSATDYYNENYGEQK